MEVSVIRWIRELEVSLSNWGALYAAILATLISIFVTRFRYMILIHRRSPASSTAISSCDFDDDFSDLDDDEVEVDDFDDVSVSSSEDDEGESETRESDEVIKSKLQREFSWSDFAKGKSVVKLWDGIGFGLDLNQSSGSLISIYDLDREQRIDSIFDKCKLPSIVRPSPYPSVVINASRASFTAWDPRTSFKSPSVVAEWDAVEPNVNRAPGLVLGGVKKVYLRDRALA